MIIVVNDNNMTGSEFDDQSIIDFYYWLGCKYINSNPQYSRRDEMSTLFLGYWIAHNYI